MLYGKKQRTLGEQIKHFALEHDSGGVEACIRIRRLEALLFKVSEQIYDQPDLEKEIQDALD